MLDGAIIELLSLVTSVCSTMLPVKALACGCTFLLGCDASRLCKFDEDFLAKAPASGLAGLAKKPRFNPLDGLTALLTGGGCSAEFAVIPDPFDNLLSGRGAATKAAGFTQLPALAFVSLALAVSFTAVISPARMWNSADRGVLMFHRELYSKCCAICLRHNANHTQTESAADDLKYWTWRVWVASAACSPCS